MIASGELCFLNLLSYQSGSPLVTQNMASKRNSAVLEFLKSEQDNFLEVVYSLRYYQVVVASELRANNMDFGCLSIELRKRYFVSFDANLNVMLDHWDTLPCSKFSSQNQTCLRALIQRRVTKLTAQAEQIGW